MLASSSNWNLMESFITAILTHDKQSFAHPVSTGILNISSHHPQRVMDMLTVHAITTQRTVVRKPSNQRAHDTD